MRLAQIVEVTDSAALMAQMRSIVSNEWTRCVTIGNLALRDDYGLLAAKLGVDSISGPYRPFLASSETLDSATLVGDENDCIQRHLFYDDEDRVKSFESFRRSYEGDPAWVPTDSCPIDAPKRDWRRLTNTRRMLLELMHAIRKDRSVGWTRPMSFASVSSSKTLRYCCMVPSGTTITFFIHPPLFATEAKTGSCAFSTGTFRTPAPRGARRGRSARVPPPPI